jgi:hypothetical protein
MTPAFDIQRVLLKAATEKIKATKAPAIPAGVASPASMQGVMPTLGGLQGMVPQTPTPQMTAGDASRSSGRSLIEDAGTVRRTAMEDAPTPVGGPNAGQILGGLLMTLLAGDQAPEVLGGVAGGFQQGMQATDARNQKAFENKRQMSELEAAALETEGKFRLGDADRADSQAQQAAKLQFDAAENQKQRENVLELEEARGKNRANVANINADSKEDVALMNALKTGGQSAEQKALIIRSLRSSVPRFKDLSDSEIEAAANAKDASMIRADAATVNAAANDKRSDSIANLNNTRAADIEFMQPFKKAYMEAQTNGAKALGESRKAAASLSRARASWYGKEAQARINKLGADAEKARTAANQTTPYKTTAWVQRGIYDNQKALDSASAYLKALDTELTDVDKRIADLSKAANDPKDVAKAAEASKQVEKLRTFKIESARNQAYWTAVKTNAESRIKEYRSQIEKGEATPVEDAKTMASAMIERFNGMGLTGEAAAAKIKQMNDKFYEMYGERPFSMGGK